MLQRIYRILLFLRQRFRRPVYESDTDGSHKEGRGSWAFVLLRAGKVLKEDSGFCKNGSSNRMEFQAAIEALKWLPVHSKARIFTDSRILLENISDRIPEWRRNSLVTKQEIPNVDLLQELDQLNQKHTISWQWVRAHSGVIYNERCDQLWKLARGD